MVKNSSASAGDARKPLEEEMAIHSSMLGWKTSWTEEQWAITHGISKSWTGLNMHASTQGRH